MPKRTDIKSILIIGAGPIVIGQACEFDYSGTQACKALKEEGYRVILVNSNPATIMTDPNEADATYIEPITPEVIEKIIAKERPDALLPTMGGQTALNTAIALADQGILEKYGVEMIAAKKDVIEKAEDRMKFREAMEKIGLDCPKSRICGDFNEADEILDFVGLPAIIRPSFTLGGQGGGIAYNTDEYYEIVKSGLAASPVTEVLIEESVLNWKEYEMEVVRDKKDNCIIICSIENIDPMGVHTGDSVTVAPALTLTDKEYQIMRDASLACLREIGVDTGGSNVQFAINPENGRMIVIEMNPRVSRSSALASKATGFPIAKIAAKLAVGYTLDELDNDITGITPASFEPTIDYVVTKIPRFAFEKFPGADDTLTTSMHAVGEAMSIGRSFQESLQKCLRSMETGLTGLDTPTIKNMEDGDPDEAIRTALARPTPDRILVIAEAFRQGLTYEVIEERTKYDPWFLEQIQDLVMTEKEIEKNGLPTDADELRSLKQKGFSDARLAFLSGKAEDAVRKQRIDSGVLPVYKRVDTCAAEFPSQTPYLYSCYEADNGLGQECEALPSDREKVIILGGGPNRIGQGIEFDYCCVHAAYALKEMGIESIMVNCNPETVSTDYDTSDRLYFEPLTEEDTLALIRKEQEKGKLKGVIVQFGGQTPLKLAAALEKEGIPILGTDPDAIDLAEDRERFQKLLQNLDLKQPANGTATTREEAIAVANKIGYPVVIRPSYVLGGRAMRIVFDETALNAYIDTAVVVSGDSPLLLDSYLENAMEVDVDALCDGKDVYVAGIMEHIEEAGIHSGDSACYLPSVSLTDELKAEMERQAVALAKALNVVGLMNIQFAIKDGEIYLLEVNPRASRTVPFVAKATGIPVAKIATKIMAGTPLVDFMPFNPLKGLYALKEAVFPFARFPKADSLLGPEMKSTGEVMGLAPDAGMAFAKTQLAAGSPLPTEGTLFLSIKEQDKSFILDTCRDMQKMGFKITATHGTADFLKENGIEATGINKVKQGRPHCVDALISGDIQLAFMTTTDSPQSIANSFLLRKTCLTKAVPHYSTVSGMRAAASAIYALREQSLEVMSLQDYAKKAD